MEKNATLYSVQITISTYQECEAVLVGVPTGSRLALVNYLTSSLLRAALQLVQRTLTVAEFPAASWMLSDLGNSSQWFPKNKQVKSMIVQGPPNILAIL